VMTGRPGYPAVVGQSGADEDRKMSGVGPYRFAGRRRRVGGHDPGIGRDHHDPQHHDPATSRIKDQ
jgi:hypothetical protein